MIPQLVALLTGGAGKLFGDGVSLVAIIAAIAPAAIWFVHNKDLPAVSFTWGQLGFGGSIVAAVVLVAWHTPPRT